MRYLSVTSVVVGMFIALKMAKLSMSSDWVEFKWEDERACELDKEDVGREDVGDGTEGIGRLGTLDGGEEQTVNAREEAGAD